MSQLSEASAGTAGGARREGRTVMSEPVELKSISRNWSAETTSTHNISLRGARVTTQRLWEPGSLLMLKSLRGSFWARARVVYWRSFSSRAIIGLEFLVHGGDWPPAN
ncbi:MAG TPA: PilZ domain-containing protein [Candidatus Dormibacteraeota bacterium]|nr:PilZ domain-containing protein [Candidatus Dormibacteraeota bacterium]